MAVKAQASITLSSVIDVQAIYRYYLLQDSGEDAPTKPTVYPAPSPWSTTEPAYNNATSNLYTVDCTVYSDGTWSYSDVSLSSSYEAVKDAIDQVTEVRESVSNLVLDANSIEASVAALESRQDVFEKLRSDIEQITSLLIENGQSHLRL